MIRAALVAALAAATLTGCAKAGKSGPETRWRAVATPADRDRLRDWRTIWVAALAAARAGDAGAVAAQGALLTPDLALANPLPPTGSYRCRMIRLGAQRPDAPRLTVAPASPCRIDRDGEMPHFAIAQGAQRPTGHFYSDSDTRAIFLGTLELGDERTPLAYGQDARRDSIGYIERIAPSRWRLVLPTPGFDSQLDVIELTPG